MLGSLEAGCTGTRTPTPSPNPDRAGRGVSPMEMLAAGASHTEGCCTWRASGRRVRHRATLAPAVELRVSVGLHGLAGCGAVRMSAHFSAACRVFAMGCSCVTPGLPRVRGGLRWRRRRRRCALRTRVRGWSRTGARSAMRSQMLLAPSPALGAGDLDRWARSGAKPRACQRLRLLSRHGRHAHHGHHGHPLGHTVKKVGQRRLRALKADR